MVNPSLGQINPRLALEEARRALATLREAADIAWDHYQGVFCAELNRAYWTAYYAVESEEARIVAAENGKKGNQ